MVILYTIFNDSLGDAERVSLLLGPHVGARRLTRLLVIVRREYFWHHRLRMDIGQDVRRLCEDARVLLCVAGV
eukprot:JP447777.1.p2 GENE.JP447777.1~~JP447777.1.p2  ORF type:complete len:73 (+),score=6.00 JP447777.1:11-229(+)